MALLLLLICAAHITTVAAQPHPTEAAKPNNSSAPPAVPPGVLRGLTRFRSIFDSVGCVYFNESIKALPFWFRSPCAGTLDEFFRPIHVGFVDIQGAGTQPTYIIQSAMVGKCWYNSNPVWVPSTPYTVGVWASATNLVACSAKDPLQHFAIYQPASDPTWRIRIPASSVCMYANAQGCQGGGCAVQKPGVVEGRFSFARCSGNWEDSWWHLDNRKDDSATVAVVCHHREAPEHCPKPHPCPQQQNTTANFSTVPAASREVEVTEHCPEQPPCTQKKTTTAESTSRGLASGVIAGFAVLASVATAALALAASLLIRHKKALQGVVDSQVGVCYEGKGMNSSCVRYE